MRIRNIVFFAISVVIGVSIVVQAKSTDGMNLFVSRKTLTDIEISIKSEVADLDSIAKRMEEAGRKLEEYEQIVASADLDFQETLMSELNMYRALTAGTAVHGPGVTIVLDDSPNEIPLWADNNAFIVHDTDILRIISDLSKGGAEAIAINGHRIYSGSTIYCSGYTVRINDEPEARPFVIQAIGDSANLSSSLLSSSSYGLLLREYYGLVFKVQVEADIEISARPVRSDAFEYARRVRDADAQQEDAQGADADANVNAGGGAKAPDGPSPPPEVPPRDQVSYYM